MLYIRRFSCHISSPCFHKLLFLKYDNNMIKRISFNVSYIYVFSGNNSADNISTNVNNGKFQFNIYDLSVVCVRLIIYSNLAS